MFFFYFGGVIIIRKLFKIQSFEYNIPNRNIIFLVLTICYCFLFFPLKIITYIDWYSYQIIV